MKIVASIQYTLKHTRTAAGTSPRRAFSSRSSDDDEERTQWAHPRNEGEGNKTADRNYREATQKFVESERGREEIKKAGNVTPSEEKDIRARRRSKRSNAPKITIRRRCASRGHQTRPESSDQSTD